MKAIYYVANIAIVLGAAALIAAVIFRLFSITWLGLWPSSILRFGNICLLLGIALYVREIVVRK